MPSIVTPVVTLNLPFVSVIVVGTEAGNAAAVKVIVSLPLVATLIAPRSVHVMFVALVQFVVVVLSPVLPT